MESQFLTFQGRGLLAIPADVRRRHHLDLPGSQVEMRERDDGVIELHPKVAVSADQAWFWTKRWQKMEGEVEDHLAAGEVKTFDTSDEFLAHLDTGDE